MARILVTESMSDLGPQWLREHGYEVRYGRGIDPETLVEDLQGCEGVITRLALFTEDVISRAKDLKVIARHGAGVDSIDVDCCRERGIVVTRNVGTNSRAVAEHAVTMMLMCAKNAEYRDRLYKNGEFDKGRKAKAYDLDGSTLGLIGMGHIGSIVAHICACGLDMKVLVYDPYAKPESLPEGAELVSDRDRVFREADYLTVHMPLTPETKKSIGAREFEIMKKSAFFINAARGPIVDEAALIQALKEGQIAGAGLDVTEKEPADPDNPLFFMDNVIMSPHVAGSTEGAKDKASMACAKACAAVLEGREVPRPAVVV